MIAIRTLLFLAGWTVWTLLLGFLALPTLFSRRASWWTARIWAGGTLRWLRFSVGITSEIQGAEHLRGARILACKHQSTWDTLMLWRVFGNPIFVLKRELFLIPVFGWYLWRSGQIGINRKRTQGVVQRIAREAAAQQAKGRMLIIFPEGTRIAPGAHKPFHTGVAKLSAALGQKVVPAALNAGKFWPKRPLWKKPGRAVLRILPPVAACGTDIAGWLKQLETTINEASAAL